ncbi:unnamed protein product [Owenia fusiformis]|uniref:Uncharacterized protein n=1 Tax=Owenia fusiformis TaxID=6347 RepID=A0A8J1TSK6_OWEFU|nr:unnamed protein product [Owenia fusiformis]
MSTPDISPSSSPASTSGTYPPKFGTVIPNRIFVGGIPPNTTEQDLKQYFSSFGAVKDSKIIADRAGVSKGYGFITFETQEDAEKIIKKEGDNLIFKDRKLNIGTAVRKQQSFPRYDPTLSPGVMVANGVPYTYQNGMAIFHSPDGGYPVAQPQTAHYVMQAAGLQGVPQMYLPQSPYQTQTAGTAPQWPVAPQTASTQWRWAPQSPPMAQNPYIYQQLPTIPQEMAMQMAYAPPQQYGHTPQEMEAAMMEATPQEGSMERSTPHHVSVSITGDNNRKPPLMPNTPSSVVGVSLQQATSTCRPVTFIQAPLNHQPTTTILTKPVPRFVTKNVNGTLINVLAKPGECTQALMSPQSPESCLRNAGNPLTPPPTPECCINRH